MPVLSLIDHTTYKRHYKTATGFSGKNVDLLIGNMLNLLARERVGAKRAMASLKEWDCWPVIRDHCAAKGKTEHGIYLHIKDLLQERTVRWARPAAPRPSAPYLTVFLAIGYTAHTLPGRRLPAWPIARRATPPGSNPHFNLGSHKP